MSAENVSYDLVWEVSNHYNSYLHKTKMSGGSMFSRDPLNLKNKHSRKWEGHASEKAIGVQPGDDNKGVKLITKKASAFNKPAAQMHTTTYASKTAPRKIYRSIASSTTKRGYRPDLREAAIARASAIKQSQRTKKDAPERKLRGKKAKKAAEFET